MKAKIINCKSIEEVVDRCAGHQVEEEVIIGVVDENKANLGWLFPRSRLRIFVPVESIKEEATKTPDGFLVKEFLEATKSEAGRHDLSKILYEIYEKSLPTARPGKEHLKSIDEVIRELKRRIITISNHPDPERDQVDVNMETPLGFESLVYENILRWIEGREAKYETAMTEEI